MNVPFMHRMEEDTGVERFTQRRRTGDETIPIYHTSGSPLIGRGESDFPAVKMVITSQVSNCHFCRPREFPEGLGGARDACRAGACVCTKAWAKAAQIFLCCLKSSFWQSREQYWTLWHLGQSLNGFSGSSSLPHLAHFLLESSGLLPASAAA